MPSAGKYATGDKRGKTRVGKPSGHVTKHVSCDWSESFACNARMEIASLGPNERDVAEKLLRKFLILRIHETCFASEKGKKMSSLTKEVFSVSNVSLFACTKTSFHSAPSIAGPFRFYFRLHGQRQLLKILKSHLNSLHNNPLVL